MRGVLCVSMLLVVFGNSASAWPWNDEPQPLLRRDKAIRADASSPLAWDESLRALWFVREGSLMSARWDGTTFETSDVGKAKPYPGGGLFVDSGSHFVYFLNSKRKPVCVRKQGSQWLMDVIGDEPVRILLGVDERRHCVFAYDEKVRGIRAYQFEPQSGAWKSKVIATGLGVAGDAGAVDAVRGVIYTVHERADETILRGENPKSRLLAAGEGVLKPWSLVATRWEKGQWSSRVICDTGVPQQPAVDNTDGSVFFARNGNPRNVYQFKPAPGKASGSLHVISGWSGSDSYKDHDAYKIRAPHYPKPWLNSVGNSNGSMNSSGNLIAIGWPTREVILTAPVTVVPYFEPIWTNTPAKPRIAHFRAVMNPRQQRLVQHRQVHAGEVIREQTGKRLAGYVYRDANGVIARQVYDSYYHGGTTASFGPLGPEFDPANPPSHFSQLAEAGRGFYTDHADMVGKALSSEGTINPESPWVPPYLRQPTSVSLRTFGHHYGSPKEDQKGGRYRHYSDQQTSLAMPSSLAVDLRTGITFYTQAPSPKESDDSTDGPSVFGGTSEILRGENASLSAFHATPETKAPRPSHEQVWIVMIY